MDPWLSWASVIAIGGAAYFYYAKGSQYFMRAAESHKNSSSDGPSAPSTRGRPTKRPNSPERPVEKPSSYAAVASDVAKRKSKTKKRRAAVGAEQAEALSSSVETPTEDDDIEQEDDAQWVEQLEARRKGVNLTANTSRAGGRQHKQLSANDSPSFSSQPSDQDTHEISTASHSRTTDRGDVSDMLEAPTPGPSTIRITGEGNQTRKPQAKPSDALTETKKQRQNRRKVEEKRLQREADEQARKKLEEAQRRTAREARGEPARNGMSTASPPVNNAWNTIPRSAPPATNGDSAARSAPDHTSSLLDTFDPDQASVSSSNENDAHQSPATPMTTASTHDLQSLPEEEQIRLATAESNDWEVPKSRKSKKKVQQAVTTSGENESDKSLMRPLEPSHPPNGRAKSPIRQSKPSTSTSSSNGFAALDQMDGDDSVVRGHPMDSEWGVVG